jgi:ankyrin repeat protein
MSLHSAARNADISILRQLLSDASTDVNVNVRDAALRTPLFDAAASGSADHVALLLSAGADVRAVDNRLQNACHWSAYNLDADVCAELIRAGVDFRARSRFRVSPFDIAVESNNLDVVMLLVRRGFDVDDAIRTDAAKLLRAAAELIHLPRERAARAHVLRFLIRRGANFRLFDSDGMATCHWACDAALAELFAFGADLSVADLTLSASVPSSTANNERLLTFVAAGADIVSCDKLFNSSASSSARQPDAGLEDEQMAAYVIVADGPMEGDMFVSPPMLAWASARIAQRQFELLRLRGFEICVGLCSLELSALELCEILMFAFVPRASLVPMHRAWAIVTMVKHWRDRHRQQMKK